MSMDKLADALIAESKKEGDKIISKAKDEAAELVRSARKEEKILVSNAEKEVKSRLESQKKERVAWANLEKRRITAEAKEDAVNSVLEGMFMNLSKLRRHRSYSSFMQEKAKEAIDELDSDSLTVHVVKGDKKHLSSIKSSKIKLVEDLDASGGLLVENKSRDIRINYTLETMFELKKPELRKGIYSSLFGG